MRTTTFKVLSLVAFELIAIVGDINNDNFVVDELARCKLSHGMFSAFCFLKKQVYK